MRELPLRWELRLRSVVSVINWIVLSLGVFLNFLSEGVTPFSTGAAAAAGVYVVSAQMIPARLLRGPTGRELLTLGGVGTSFLAAALAGGSDSVYLLLAATAIVVGSVGGGTRLAVASTALAIGLLGFMVMAETPIAAGNFVRWGTLYLLVFLTLWQATRLIVEEGARADALAAASAETTVRLERLENANRLLSRLSDLGDQAELNPVEVGDAALAGLRPTVPFRFAAASLVGEDGPTVVATLGTETPGYVRTRLPLLSAGREVGNIVLITDRNLTERQLVESTSLLQPATVAFSNIILLQQIARTAMREERARLARELHDEIGPSLASLGLALDLAVLQHPTQPALGAHLVDLRSSVTDLVEDVRSAVADLRAQDRPTMTLALKDVIAELEDDAHTFDLRLDEAVPPPASIASDIRAIVIEAIRNAARHSQATVIRVEGSVDAHGGWVTVTDDGRGFASEEPAEGRFGLTGMRERAARASADLDISSSADGTIVRLRWDS